MGEYFGKQGESFNILGPEFTYQFLKYATKFVILFIIFISSA